MLLCCCYFHFTVYATVVVAAVHFSRLKQQEKEEKNARRQKNISAFISLFFVYCMLPEQRLFIDPYETTEFMAWKFSFLFRYIYSTHTIFCLFLFLFPSCTLKPFYVLFVLFSFSHPTTAAHLICFIISLLLIPAHTTNKNTLLIHLIQLLEEIFFLSLCACSSSFYSSFSKPMLENVFSSSFLSAYTIQNIILRSIYAHPINEH